MLRRPALFTFALLSLGLASHPSAHASVPVGYQQVADAYDLPAEVLYAVALTESARKVDSTGNVRPWPWTLNFRGRGHFFSSRDEAETALQRFLEQGRTSVDIGLMQVNWRYHEQRLGSPQRALDPYHNLRVAAEILRDCHQSRQDWWAAVGCYHAPNSPRRAAQYRTRVRAHWQRVIRRG
jgi:hypothetical protein